MPSSSFIRREVNDLQKAPFFTVNQVGGIPFHQVGGDKGLVRLDTHIGNLELNFVRDKVSVDNEACEQGERLAVAETSLHCIIVVRNMLIQVAGQLLLAERPVRLGVLGDEEVLHE